MSDTALIYQHGPNPRLLPWLKPTWLSKVVVVPPPPDLGLLLPCLLWLGGKSPDGYGLLRMQDGKMAYMHRRAWEEVNGEQLGPTRDGHHKCYRRNCFQAAHIEVATRGENRGPTQFRCQLAADELIALYNLYEYEMRPYA